MSHDIQQQAPRQPAINVTRVSETVPVCCGPETAGVPQRLHLSLHVSDLPRSVEFYRILLGVRPARQEQDYCKFELTRPPLVLSLIPYSRRHEPPQCALNFPVHQREEVQHLAGRWQRAGLIVTWEHDPSTNASTDGRLPHSALVSDPDGLQWRVSCREQDLAVTSPADDSGPSESPGIHSANHVADPISSITAQGWEHRLPATWPAFIPHDDMSLDLVQLEGTWNADCTNEQRLQLLSEVRRVLTVGGLVRFHGLVSDQPLPDCPQLPGVAGVVRRVPILTEVLGEFQQAGFQDLEMTRLPDRPAFRWGSAQLRELKFQALRAAAPVTRIHAELPPETLLAMRTSVVIYRGPWNSITIDGGQVFPRGQPQRISGEMVQRLQSPMWSGVFLWPDSQPAARKGFAENEGSALGCHDTEFQ